jgi:hypothetical protein
MSPFSESSETQPALRPPASGGRAGKKRGRSSSSKEMESVIDALGMLTENASSKTYFDDWTEGEALQRRVDFVLDVKARVQKIDDERKERSASRRLASANGWTAIAIKLLAAVSGAAIVVILALNAGNARYQKLIEAVFSHDTWGYLLGAAVGAAVMAGPRLLGSMRADSELDDADANEDSQTD